MSIKKLLKRLIIIPTAFILSSCQMSDTTVPTVTGDFTINVLDVGKADSMILSTSNHNVIIDCGESDDGDKIVEYLNENNISHIDYLFITHFDKDHIGGFSELVENIKIDNIIAPDYESEKDEYQNYIKALKKNNLSVTTLKKDMSFTLDDCVFKINPPQEKSYESENDFSLAISVTHGDNKFLFMGDAEEIRTKEILDIFNGKYDFLKIPHHGQFNAMTQTLISSVQPQYVVITDSNKNPADDKLLNILENSGCNVYRTANGSIKAVSDGSKILVN